MKNYIRPTRVAPNQKEIKNVLVRRMIVNVTFQLI